MGSDVSSYHGSTSSGLGHSVKKISLSEPQVLSWDRARDVK